MSGRVYVSYAWRGADGAGADSEDTVDELARYLDRADIQLIRDKSHLGYKGSISAFMREIGKASAVIVVLSDKYLKSENCMFELVELANAGDLGRRIFPVVLNDARIFTAETRLDYAAYWEQRKQALVEKSRSLDAANQRSVYQSIDQFDEYRRRILDLLALIGDWNTLTSDLHHDQGFQSLIVGLQTAFGLPNTDSLESQSDAQDSVVRESSSARVAQTAMHRLELSEAKSAGKSDNAEEPTKMGRGKAVGQADITQTSPEGSLLLVTVNEHEMVAVRSVFENASGSDSALRHIDGSYYRFLGSLNGRGVWLAISEMGTSGIGASWSTVQRGIQHLRPAQVIMIGVAFGVDESKQNIGDLLVAKQLVLYESQRVGQGEIIPRGDRVTCSSRLLTLFRHVQSDWNQAKVRFGQVLSGEKLVDDLDYRESLRKLSPEVIGGEMEGAGLYAACQEARVDWVLVKGICDWADGNKGQDKDARQEQAARNAAEFVHFALAAPLAKLEDLTDPGQEANAVETMVASNSGSARPKADTSRPPVQHVPVDCSVLCDEVGRFLTNDVLQPLFPYLEQEATGETDLRQILCNPPADEAISRLNRALQSLLDFRVRVESAEFARLLRELVGWLALRAVEPGQLQPVIDALVAGSHAWAEVAIRDSIAVEVVVSFAQGRKPEFRRDQGNALRGEKWLDTRVVKRDLGEDELLREELEMLHKEVFRDQRDCPTGMLDSTEIEALRIRVQAVVDDREGSYYTTASLLGQKDGQSVDRAYRRLQGTLPYLKIVLTGSEESALDLLPSGDTMAAKIENLFNKLERLP